MKRSAAIFLALAASLVSGVAQRYPSPQKPPNRYAPRPLPPGRNPALTNTLRGARTNLPPANRYAPIPSPAVRFSTNPSAATNFGPASRSAPSPLPATNFVPRSSYSTDVSREEFPTETNSPTPNRFSTNVALPNSARTNSAPRPVPGSTNAHARLLITPAQRQNINYLTALLTAIRTPQVSPIQRQQLLNTLRVSAQGPAKPSLKSVKNLVDEIVAAWPARNFVPQHKAQLAIDLSRVFNSANLTPQETGLVINDARRIFQMAGVEAESLDRLVDGLTAIADEIKQPLATEAVP